MIVVLGGMGSFLGALLGGFVVGLAESIGAAVLPGSLKQLPIFALFVLVLLFRPNGLLGRARGVVSRRRSLAVRPSRCRRSSRPTPSTRWCSSCSSPTSARPGTCWAGTRGQFSFGHAAFFGIGAYTSTLLLVRLGVSPWLGLLAGGALAAAFGSSRDISRSATGSAARTSRW